MKKLCLILGLMTCIKEMGKWTFLAARCLMVIGAIIFYCSTVSPAATSAPKTGKKAPVPAQAKSPEQAMQDLYREAKEAGESEVVWQVSSSLKEMQPFADKFQARFPDIKVKAFSLAGTEVPARIVTEAAVGKGSMDVTGGVFELLMPLIERDLLTKLDFLKTMGVEANTLYLNNSVVGRFYDLNAVWIRNTSLVPKKDELHSWEDALNPKWKGNKISVRGAGLFFNSLMPEWLKNKQKVVTYLQKLKEQKLVAGARATEVLRRVVQGETPIGLANLHHLPLEIKSGAPIALMPVSPVVGRPTIHAIPKKAPHPHAAKLFLAWRCSKESADLEAQMGLGMASPPGASVMADLLHDAGIKFIRLTKEQDIRNLGPFTEMVEKTLGFEPE